MWRAFFLAVGTYACILGGECLILEKAVLKTRHERAPGLIESSAGRSREIAPPDWAPWSLMSVGAVTVLYSFTIPQRVRN